MPAAASWATAPALLAALAGAWPTLHLGGSGALAAQAVALAVVCAVSAIGAIAVVSLAPRGAVSFAYGFLMAGFARAVATAGLAAVCAWALGLPAAALMLWTVGLYLASLAGEATYVYRVLRRDAGRTQVQ
jgi:hypothetical protein